MMDVIGNVYVRLGLYPDGQRMIEGALARRRALPDPSDSAIAATLYDLGQAQQWRGQYAAAESTYREALAIRRRLFDDDHPEVLHSFSAVAGILRAQGSYAPAESLYRHVAQSLNNYAIFLRASGHGVAAESVFVRALEAYRRSVGENHPDYAAALNGIAVGRLRRNDCAGAIPLFRRAADIYEHAVNADFWIPNAIRINLGRCLTTTKQYAEAERALLASHERLARALGDTSGQARRAREQLVALYDAWGRPARAAAFRAKPN